MKFGGPTALYFISRVQREVFWGELKFLSPEPQLGMRIKDRKTTVEMSEVSEMNDAFRHKAYYTI